MRLTTPDYGRNRLIDVTHTQGNVLDYITLAEAKLWLRVDGDEEDDQITELLDEAVQQAEQVTGRSLTEKTYTATYATFSAEVPVPFAPIDEIISVHRLNQGEEVEITGYYVIADRLRFETVYGDSHPYYQQGLKIVYTAKVDSVPVKTAIKQMLLTNYEDRQDNADSIMQVPSNSRKKLMKFKRYVN